MINYKKIIPSRTIRLKLLKLTSFIPDKLMLKIQYRIKTGRKLNLKNPMRYSEKIQLYKLYYKNKLMIQCVDKYDVRDYVKNKGLGHILTENYGLYNNIEDIDFSILPTKFVIKDTLGGGGTSVYFCNNKQINISDIKKTFSNFNSNCKKGGGREWPYYSGKKNRLIVEELLEPDNGQLIEYKFFCFQGKVEYLYVISDRIIGHSATFGIFDKNFKNLHIERAGKKVMDHSVAKPDNYNLMKQYAEILSEDFPHARIDLYSFDNKIYFGEITFFNASGYVSFNPDSFDFELGKCFIIERNKWQCIQ